MLANGIALLMKYMSLFSSISVNKRGIVYDKFSYLQCESIICDACVSGLFAWIPERLSDMGRHQSNSIKTVSWSKSRCICRGVCLVANPFELCNRSYLILSPRLQNDIKYMHTSMLDLYIIMNFTTYTQVVSQKVRVGSTCLRRLLFATHTSISATHSILAVIKADARFAPSQSETSLQSNTVSHWLCGNVESALSCGWALCI